MIFNIPCNRNTVLSPHDTYLKFSMTATNGATAQDWVRLSKAGAHGLNELTQKVLPKAMLVY
jgi:hypothetical protein